MQSEATLEAESGLGWLLAMRGTLIVITGTVWRKGYDLTQEGVQILRRLGQSEMMVMPLMSLFVTAYRVGEDVVLVQAANECLEIATTLGDSWSVVKAKQLLALYAIKVEQFQDAERFGNEALAICENLGDRWSLSALCIEVMSTIAIRREEYQRACQWLNQGLQIAIATDLTNAIQLAYFQLGYVAALQGNFQEAGKYWHQALRIADYFIGDKLNPSWFSVLLPTKGSFSPD
jgi:tetratricopeptide (TPR) repeat protein